MSTTIILLHDHYSKWIVVVAYIKVRAQHFSDKIGPNILINVIYSYYIIELILKDSTSHKNLDAIAHAVYHNFTQEHMF